MKILHHCIHGSQALDLSRQPAATVHATACHGRGTRVLIPAGWISVTLVLTGMLEISGGDAPWQLAAHHLQLWLEGELRLISRGHAWWLCIAAPAALWERLPCSTSLNNHLIPRELRCDRELASTVLHLARKRCFNNSSDTTAVQDGMQVLRDTLVERQQALHGQLSRCSGRTALRRHQTLLRLLRVQHLIRCNSDGRLDLNRLAAIANYSPPHLIRIYREVFDETPFEYAHRLRLQRAWELVCTTDLSICEIAGALGFETESAFCRSFKQSFACTASQARRSRATNTTATGVSRSAPMHDLQAELATQ